MLGRTTGSGWHRLAAVAVSLGLGLSACATPSGLPTESVPAGGSSGSQTGSISLPTIDLTGPNLTFFGPLPPNVPHMGYGGSDDFIDLFSTDAQWPAAAAKVDVFLVPASWVLNYASDDQLHRVVSGLAARGIAFGLGIGAFAARGCGVGVEGYDFTLDTIQRIHQAGGRVDLVTWDEPLAFSVFYDGEAACGWTIEHAASVAGGTVSALRRIEPAVVIGEDEPLWTGMSADDYAAWLDAYRSAAGEPLAFIHLDADWVNRPDWPEALADIADVAHARDVAFGPIYNGGDATSDAAWTGLTMQRAARYEESAGHQVDHVVLQSWMDHPDRVLPESDPTTFTGMILRYFGSRTTLEATDVQAGSGTVALSVRAATTDGAALGGVPLEVTAEPLDGARQLLTLEGVVPADADEGVVGLRINTEGAGPGDADLRIYGFSYADGGADANRLSNPAFAAGMADWFVYGDGNASTVPSDSGPGSMLTIRAGPDRSVMVDHAGLAVAAGSAFHLEVTAAFPSSSVGSAYAAVMFLHGGEEFDRQRLALTVVGLPPIEGTTNDAGVANLTLDGLQPGRYRLVMTYAGDATHWPAETTTEVAIP